MNLIDTWDWVRSSDGITGEATTSESTESTMRFKITNTVIKRYLNNDLVSERFYSIEVKEPMSRELREMIIQDNGSGQIINIEGQILVLTGDCNDCLASE